MSPASEPIGTPARTEHRLSGYRIRPARQWIWVWGGVLALIGCRADDATPRRTQARSIERPSTQPPLDSKKPASAAPAIARRAQPAPGCPDADQAFARARKLSARGQWSTAIDSFDAAIRARPVDARLRAERGYAYLRWGKPTRALTDFVDALKLTRDGPLLAHVWFNIGLSAEKLEKRPLRRLALAVAHHHGSAAAVKRLGSESSCPAIWVTQSSAAVPIARNWEELARERNRACYLPALAPQAKPSARERACRGCGYGDSDRGDRCQGKGPWTIESGYMNTQTFMFFVLPLPGGSFHYQNLLLGDQPSPFEVDGPWLVLTTTASDFLPRGSDSILGHFRSGPAGITVGGGWSDEQDYEGQWTTKAGTGCEPILDAAVPLEEATTPPVSGEPRLPPLPVPRVREWISIEERRLVLRVETYAGEVSVSIQDERARLRGSGCDADIPLR